MQTINPTTKSSQSHQTLRLIYWLLFIVVLIFAITVQYVIPTFKPLLSSFGADLPWLTNFVLEYHALIFILPLYELAMAIMVTVNKTMPADVQKIFKIIFFIDALTHIALFATVGIAMYLPILSMGKVV
jgi:type II secretory pathway component PulF